MTGLHFAQYRRPRARRLVIALCALGAIVAIAVLAPEARAGWTAPITVSSPHDAIGNLQVGAGPSENLISWRFYDLLAPGRQMFGAPGARYSVSAASGAFGPERVLPASYTTGSLVALGEGRLAQLILRRTGPNTSRAEVALGSVGGSFSGPLAVAGSVLGARASLAGNSRGELLLSWIGVTPSGRRQVWASVRRSNGRFSKPELISAGTDAQQVSSFMAGPIHRTDLGGFAADMLVTFASGQGRMLVRIRRHLAGWGRVQDVGPAAIGTVNDVSARIGRNGRMIVAWSHQQLSEGGPLGPGFTQVAVLPANAHGFLPAQTLERDPSASVPGEPVVLADNGRGFLVAFLAQPGRPSGGYLPALVRVAYSAGDRFAGPRTISPPGQGASGLAGAEGLTGDIVTWSSSPSGAERALNGPAVYAAVGSPSSIHLGSPQRVSPSERAEDAVPAYSFATGSWLVAWAGRPGYRSPANAGQDTVRVSYGS